MVQQPPSVDPQKSQTITPYELQMHILNKLLTIDARMDSLINSFQTLSQTMALNMKQNLDMMQKINEYIGEQMSYRIYRQQMEENNIKLQLEQKDIELKYIKQKYDTLTVEKQEDDAEAMNFAIEREKLRLEVEALRKNLEALQESKHSTQDKVKTLRLKSEDERSKKIKDTILYTAIATVTAASVGGLIAFAIWLLRFYVQNTPN